MAETATGPGPEGTTDQRGEAAKTAAADPAKTATGTENGAAAEARKTVAAAEDFAAKFEGQRQVNRDLESKLNQLRDGLKGALGIDDKKADATELVSRLQDQLNSLAHTNLVSDVARRHRITDDEDLTILSGIKDKDAMEKLAARLSPGDGTDPGKPGSTISGKPGTPKPDPSQGSPGGGKASTSVAAGRDLWSERHPTTK